MGDSEACSHLDIALAVSYNIKVIVEIEGLVFLTSDVTSNECIAGNG